MTDADTSSWTSQARPGDGVGELLSRERWIIVVMTVIGLVAALAISLAMTPKYEASTTVRFRDVSGDLNILGASTASEQQPAAVAAQGAEQVTRSGVLRRALRLLSTDGRVDPSLRGNSADAGAKLRSIVSTEIDPSSFLVSITASAEDGRTASTVANTVAQATVDTVNGDQRAGFLAQADRVRAALRAASRGGERARSDDAILLQSYQTQISRLEALGRVAEPASIAVLSRPPGSPSSPKLVFNVVLGTLLGLIAGLGIGVARRMRRSTIESPDEIQAESDLPVVAVLAPSAFGAVPELIGDLSPDALELLEAARQLRTAIEYTDPSSKPRLIGVLSALPEEGKTTTAAALACASAIDGRRTLLVDADLRRASLPERFSVPAEPGLADFLAGVAEPADTLRTIPVTPSVPVPAGTDRPELVYMPPGRVLGSTSALLGSDRLGEALDEMRDAYDLVILDCAPLLPVADTVELLSRMDAAVVCVRMRRTPRNALRGLKELLDRSPVTNVVAVATDQRSRRSGSRRYEYYGSSYGETSESGAVRKRRRRGLRRKRR
jgi:Mrp family chromosome partitioning ATPase